MSIERKSYPVASMKVADETPGVIEAIVSVFNNVDSGKEIVRPGFFQKSIDKKLPKGVWAHDWKQPIAKTLEARELLPGDSLLPPELMTLGGAYIKGQFNLETQRGREAYSDIKFGIVDEFSIGYGVVKDGKDEETGARELIEGDWKEWSPVLVGMNDQTRLISIKTEDTKILDAIKTECDCPPEAGDVCTHKSNLNLKDESVADSLESFDKAVSAIEKNVANMQRNHENRVKEGRVLSTSNRATVQQCRDSLAALMNELNDLLMMTEPKPKEKEIDVEALRTQSMRSRSRALGALAL